MQTDHVPRQRQRTIFDDTVASRIDQLLQRCNRIRRGTEIDRPHVFNRDGQRHARTIAQRDAAPRESQSG